MTGLYCNLNLIISPLASGHGVDSEEAGAAFGDTVLLVVFKQGGEMPSIWKCSYFCRFKVIMSDKIFKFSNTDVPIPILENTNFPIQDPNFSILYLPGMRIKSSLKC